MRDFHSNGRSPFVLGTTSLSQYPYRSIPIAVSLKVIRYNGATNLVVLTRYCECQKIFGLKFNLILNSRPAC